MQDTSRKRQQAIEVLGPDPGDRRQPCKDWPEHDPLAEPIDVGLLQVAVKRTLGQCRAEDQVVSVLKKQQGRPSCPKVVSINPRMTAIFDLIDRVAQTATTVLIEGETGTGKEQVAQAIHQLSRSRFGPMVAVTCAALSEQLLESELFGHEKGASPVPSAGARAGLNWHRGALYSSMRSATCHRQCRPSFCASCRKDASSASAARRALQRT